MKRIVVAAKAGADEPWLAEAAANLAEQTAAEVSVVSVDGLDVEMGAPMPREEYAKGARESARRVAEQIRQAGIQATDEVRPGRVVRGVLVFAEEKDADLILVGASRRSAMAKRLLGDVSLELVSRSRRPVMVIAPPSGEGQGR
jgi:nucleotide-binding universal stress UspA family protein